MFISSFLGGPSLHSLGFTSCCRLYWVKTSGMPSGILRRLSLVWRRSSGISSLVCPANLFYLYSKLTPIAHRRYSELYYSRKRVSKIPSMIEVEPVDKLVSGWDDMIKMTTLGRNSPKSPSPSRTRSPNSTIRSGTASPVLGSSSQRPALSLRTSNEETLHSSISSTSSAQSSLPEDRPTSPEDDAFCASTIQYLGSPTAYSLGLQSPLIHPPSVYRSPTQTREGAPQWKQSSMLSVPQSIPDDVQSTVSSIFDMPWPQPPSPPLFTPAFSETVYGEHNSSFENVRNYALPFQGPTVHPIPGGSRPVSPLDRSVSPTKAKKYLRRGAIHGPPGETVYMTVVQETA